MLTPAIINQNAALVRIGKIESEGSNSFVSSADQAARPNKALRIFLSLVERR